MKFTDEQEHIIDTVVTGNPYDIYAVQAVAGSGKTATAVALTETYKPKNGLYSCFNKAILEDSKKRIGHLLDCKTFHALAYKHVAHPKGIEEFNYSSIKEDIPYEEKALIIKVMDGFFRSKSDNIFDYMEGKLEDHLQDILLKYANLMMEGKIPCTFNFMLKALHLMLLSGEAEISFDLVLFDEVQDVVEVTLEIFKLLKADRKVILGDTFQNIYSFMDTVNAFEELKDTVQLKLTNSFRCSPEIGHKVEMFGKKYLNSNFKFTGTNTSKLSKDSVANITRTNAQLVAVMHSLVKIGSRFSLTRSCNDIFALPIALLSAASGKQVYDKRYKYLEKEYQRYITNRKNHNSFFSYIISETGDENLLVMSQILADWSMKRINIYDLKRAVTDMRPDKNLIVTTAHAFKGMEVDTVLIEDDLNNSLRKADKLIGRYLENLPYNMTKPVIEELSLDKDTRENLNTYYVALSRAKHTLLNAAY